MNPSPAALNPAALARAAGRLRALCRAAAALAPPALLALAAAAAPAAAQPTPDTPPGASPNEQVIVPEVERRAVKVPRIPSNDFEIGVFGGTYATQNFGTSAVKGVRLGYHITEDFFVEATGGETRVSDEVYRRIVRTGGIFAQPTEKLTYYNFSIGWNVLPGEVFFGRRFARPSAGYLVAGAGSTRFFEQRRQSLHYGFGLRLFLADWVALQADMRNHLYSLDLLGQRENTQNLEVSAGLTFFF